MSGTCHRKSPTGAWVQHQKRWSSGRYRSISPPREVVSAMLRSASAGIWVGFTRIHHSCERGKNWRSALACPSRNRIRLSDCVSGPSRGYGDDRNRSSRLLSVLMLSHFYINEDLEQNLSSLCKKWGTGGFVLRLEAASGRIQQRIKCFHAVLYGFPRILAKL